MASGTVIVGWVTYQVKDGCIAGDPAEPAVKTGDGTGVLEDGWYFVLDGQDDGVGPLRFEPDSDSITTWIFSHLAD